ncbi:MAG: YebY family protein [Burkholderiaceae bacterium]|nr:YebY family protein [Burkholderiaceae bacterium]
MRRYAIFAIMSMTGIVAAAQSGKIEISRSQMGKDWPFTVDKGTLRCASSMVTFEANGTIYAINGTASSRAASMGWRDVSPIWKENMEIPGTKIGIGSVTNKGLELCK